MRTARKAFRLEIKRRIVRSAVGLKEMNNSAIWKIRPRPLKEKDFITSVTAGKGRGVEAPATLGSFAPTKRNWIGTLDRVVPHQGAARDERLKEGAAGAVGE
jgi:hypothetical protein